MCASRLLSCAIPCQITKAAKKLHLVDCPGAAHTRRKRAAIVFEAARSCVEAASSFFGAEKSCVSSMRGQNLTKKIKFFQEKAVTFKKF
jgi:hypothetical protein